MSYSLHVQQILNKYSSDSKAHLRLATGGYQGEVFLKIISGEPRPRAWEEVREAREVALSLVFITCNLDGFSVSGERWSNLLSGGHIITPFCQCWKYHICLREVCSFLSIFQLKSTHHVQWILLVLHFASTDNMYHKCKKYVQFLWYVSIAMRGFINRDC